MIESGQLAKLPISRIENDIEALKKITSIVESTTDRIMRHARSLGYFEPPKDSANALPSAVIMTLADAIHALDRAVDHCSGSLNVFD
jgi:hypothetical protein